MAASLRVEAMVGQAPPGRKFDSLNSITTRASRHPVDETGPPRSVSLGQGLRHSRRTVRRSVALVPGAEGFALVETLSVEPDAPGISPGDRNRTHLPRGPPVRAAVLV